MPSNYEVAIELDRIADEEEGGERQRRLVEMRRTALRVMSEPLKLQPQAHRERVEGYREEGERHRPHRPSS